MNTHGIGLGLTTCAHIVSEYGGKIELEQTSNLGSTFTFTFKLHEYEQPCNQLDFKDTEVQMNKKAMYFTWQPTSFVAHPQPIKYLFNLN